MRLTKAFVKPRRDAILAPYAPLPCVVNPFLNQQGLCRNRNGHGRELAHIQSILRMMLKRNPGPDPSGMKRIDDIDITTTGHHVGAPPIGWGYLAIDFVISNNAEIYFLEINDRPLGITRDRLLMGRGGGLATEYLTRFLLDNSLSSGPVLVALPLGLEIFTPSHALREVPTDPSVNPGDRNVHMFEEYNVLAQLFRRDRECLIVDHSKTIAEAVSRGDSGFSLLLRWALPLPQLMISRRICNSLQLRPLCQNKLDAASLVKKHVSTVNGLRVPLKWLRSIDALNTGKDNVLLKPVSGRAGQNIRRLACARLRCVAEAELNLGSRPGEYFLEEWIEPATINSPTGRRYIDVRVFVLGGAATEPVYRVAAASFEDSRLGRFPLSYIASSGTWHAWGHGPPLVDPGFSQADRLREELIIYAETIANVIAAHSALIKPANAAHWIKDAVEAEFKDRPITRPPDPRLPPRLLRYAAPC
jgi:hypothetical protein